MSNRYWEQALQSERLQKAKKIYQTYEEARDKGMPMNARQEAIMETLGWILLDNDEAPEKYEQD